MSGFPPLRNGFESWPGKTYGIQLTCTVSEAEGVGIEGGVVDKIGIEVKEVGEKGVGVTWNKEIRQKYYFYERPL